MAKREREREREKGQISSGCCAGVEGFKMTEEAYGGGGLPGSISCYRIMT